MVKRTFIIQYSSLFGWLFEKSSVKKWPLLDSAVGRVSVCRHHFDGMTDADAPLSMVMG